MKLIVLKGDDNKGKSATLRIVYNVLHQLGYHVTDNILKRLGDAVNNDFIDALANAEHKIGIATMGDYEDTNTDCLDGETVQGLYLQLEQIHCNIIILACNNKLANAINFLTERNAKFIDKLQSNKHIDFDKLNQNDALKIMKEILTNA